MADAEGVFVFVLAWLQMGSPMSIFELAAAEMIVLSTERPKGSGMTFA
jgi:hypothetical protein